MTKQFLPSVVREAPKPKPTQPWWYMLMWTFIVGGAAAAGLVKVYVGEPFMALAFFAGAWLIYLVFGRIE